MIKDSIKIGKRVLAPITDKKSSRLIFSDLKDFDVELKPSAFGVPEPSEEYRRIVRPTETDLIVVPGVAFDKHCHRLSHGRGYYDRSLQGVLSTKPDVPTIGLAYEFQVLEELPHCQDDVPVRKIVTEKRVITSGKLKPCTCGANV